MFDFLTQRLGRDVREGKRRQFSYIGKLIFDISFFVKCAFRPFVLVVRTNKNHDSPQLYNIIYFEPKLSWFCFLFSKRPRTNGDSVPYL